MGQVVGVKELELWASRQKFLTDHRFFKTSGSSGVEKWVALSREALEWSARSVIDALEITRKDVLGLALPEIHVGGYGVVVRAKLSGSRLARFDVPWKPAAFGGWCRDERVTVSSLVPTQVYDLVRAGIRAAESLRVIVVGGGALEEELKSEARTLGWPVVPSYGMTETSSQIATGDGLPLLPGWEARVVEGCLAVKGGGLLTVVIEPRGEGFVARDPKEEGWFLTSDRVHLEGRCLSILGRADRQVKVLGSLVDLEKLETIWRRRLGCRVAVLTSPHERRGVTLHLYHEGGDRDLAVINEQLPGPERLTDWSAITKLPLSPLGKIDRVALRKFHHDKGCHRRRNERI